MKFLGLLILLFCSGAMAQNLKGKSLQLTPGALPTKGFTGEVRVIASPTPVPYFYDGTSWGTLLTSSTTLDGLSDVTVPTPNLNDRLAWNGSSWVNVAASTGGPAGSGINYYSTLPVLIAGSTVNDFNLFTLSLAPIASTNQTHTATTSGAQTIPLNAADHGPAVGRTSIAGGTWTFNNFLGVNSVLVDE